MRRFFVLMLMGLLALAQVSVGVPPAVAVVVEVTARNDYTGNGSTTVFAYTWRVVDQAHIEILVDGVTKTLTTDYTVSGVGASAGGNVTFVTAPANNTKVTILRKQPFAQPSAYITGEGFPSGRVEKDLDKLVMIAQQLTENLNRAVKLPKKSTLTGIDLPEPNADKFIKWNAAGTALEAAPGTTVPNLNLYGDVSSIGALTTIGANKVTLGMMATGTAGNLITYSAVGAPAAVTTGTAGQILTSNGAGAAPTFQAAAAAIGGSGTINYIPKFTASTTLGNSQISDNGTFVGIGIPNPGNQLHVRGNTAGSVDIVVDNLDQSATSKSNYLTYLSDNTGVTAFASALEVGKEGLWTSNALTRNSYMAFKLLVKGGHEEKMRLAGGSDGNVAALMIGSMASPVSGGPLLGFTNGNTPAGTTGLSGIFGKNATVTELYAFDGGGNITLLSPHLSDFLNTRPVKTTGPYAYPWIYTACNSYLGKCITADLAGLFEWALLQGAPAGLVVLEDLPPNEREDWDTVQEGVRVRRERDIAAARMQSAELDAKIKAETDLKKKDKLQKERADIKMPAPHVKEKPPKWMIDRGVKSAIP